tara:strand:- start:200 stop:316 length:117 start_codon:yes stop_codon:yes gene_type:complete
MKKTERILAIAYEIERVARLGKNPQYQVVSLDINTINE